MTTLQLMAMIWLVFEYWNYAVLLYVNSFQLFLSQALVKWNFLLDGKKAMWLRSTKMVINSASKITDLSLYSQSAVRSLKDFYLKTVQFFKWKWLIIIQLVRLSTHWLLHKSTPFYHPRNISIFRWWSRGKRRVFRHIESLW